MCVFISFRLSGGFGRWWWCLSGWWLVVGGLMVGMVWKHDDDDDVNLMGGATELDDLSMVRSIDPRRRVYCQAVS